MNEQGALVTAEGYVATDSSFPRHQWLWVGSRIVADLDGKQFGGIIILAHKPADLTDRVARAIADADGNSQPRCVYITLAEAATAAMAADGAE